MGLTDFRDKAVLITGGTKGIGLATGLAFAEEGARVYLTHKWGSADEEAVCARFTDRGLPRPEIVEADAAEDEDTVALLEGIKERHDRLEAFVSNVAFAQVTDGPESYKKKSLFNSLGYSAWPLVNYLQRSKEIFGAFPRYAIGCSSDGVDNYYPGYDAVAASKVVMETICRYLNTHLFEEDIRINILRSRPVSTDSLRATFGEEFEPFLRKYGGDDFVVGADQVADAIVCLCSGLMDAVSGQVITLDNGVIFRDNIMRMFERREKLGL